MDAVTYPFHDVRVELSHWIHQRVDVVADSEIAAAFGVSAIPLAVLIDGEGRILDRIVGFVEPEEFLERISSVRIERQSALGAATPGGR